MTNGPLDRASRRREGAPERGVPGFWAGRAGFEGLVESLLGIRPGEGRRTTLCFAYLFLSSSVFILGRAARDTLFLSRYPIRALPWMFVLFGVVSALVALFYGLAAERAGRLLQIRAALAVGAASYAAVWLLIRAGVSWVYPAFYAWTEVIANLLIMQFWTLANDLHDPREAKRLFGTIGSARILGVIVCGLTAGLVVRLIGTVNLLWVLAGIAAALFLLTFPLDLEYRRAVFQPGAARTRPGKGAPAWRNPYVRSLALVILLIFVALTVGDYQFKIIARASYEGREDDLARFFSLFYAGAGLLGFLFQILATPRVLRRYGVLAAMLVMPLVFGGSSLALLLAGGLVAASLMKLSDNSFQYTIHETALQVLYVPFSAAVKAKTRALLDTAVKPLAYGLGGLVLVVAAQRFLVPVRHLALITLPVVALWIALLPLVRRRYLGALEASLSGRAAAFATGHELVLDSGSRAVLLKTLGSPDPLLVLHALERLAGEDTPALRSALRALLSHPDPKVREEALERLSVLRDEPALAQVTAALEDGSPGVRAAAVTALAALKGDDAVERVAALLEDESRLVRATAAARLIADGGIEGAVLGGGKLEGLLAGREPKQRVEAAEILARLGPAGFRPLRRLLLDEAPEVRKAALKAAPAVADRRLVPLLLEALHPAESRGRSAKALAAVGPAAVPGLVQRLADPGAPRPVRLLIPRILKKIAVPEAFAALEGMDPIQDGHVRLRAYSAMGSLREKLGLGPLPVHRVRRRIEAEARDAYGLLVSWEEARPPYGTPLFEDSVETSLRRARRRLLRLLELLYPRSETGLILRHLESPARSAMALETLDTLLEPQLKPLVIPLMEDLPAQKRLEKAGALVPRATPPLLFLAARCAHPEPYCAFGALTAAAEHEERGVLSEARQALGHPDPLVREGAILAVARLAQAEEARALLAPFAGDPTQALSLPVRRFLSRTEEAMYSTVEKILFLMSVPIFEKLPGEDLAPLAQAAEVESHHPGALIVKEGDVGDALYVVLRGRVAIEKGGQALATLGPKDTFGEMAVLDAEARSADAVALEETEVLKIGSEEFYEVLREQTEIAEGVLKVLSRRLREADAQLKGRP